MYKKTLFIFVGLWMFDAQCASNLGRLTPSPTNTPIKKLTPPAAENPFPYIAKALQDEDDAEIKENPSIKMLPKIAPKRSASVGFVSKHVPNRESGSLDNQMFLEKWNQAFGMAFAARRKHLVSNR